MTVLTSPAWIIGGMRNRPGYLATDGSRVTFTDGETTCFDVPLAEITDVRYPWYWFGGGVRLRAADRLHKITFVRPNGMPAPDPSIADIAFGVLGVVAATGGISHGDALRGLADIAPGRAATARWKEVLPS